MLETQREKTDDEDVRLAAVVPACVDELRMIDSILLLACLTDMQNLDPHSRRSYISRHQDSFLSVSSPIEGTAE
jgi:hypothetical protein